MLVSNIFDKKVAFSRLLIFGYFPVNNIHEGSSTATLVYFSFFDGRLGDEYQLISDFFLDLSHLFLFYLTRGLGNVFVLFVLSKYPLKLVFHCLQIVSIWFATDFIISRPRQGILFHLFPPVVAVQESHKILFLFSKLENIVVQVVINY